MVSRTLSHAFCPVHTGLSDGERGPKRPLVHVCREHVGVLPRAARKALLEAQQLEGLFQPLLARGEVLTQLDDPRLDLLRHRGARVRGLLLEPLELRVHLVLRGIEAPARFLRRVLQTELRLEDRILESKLEDLGLLGSPGGPALLRVHEDEQLQPVFPARGLLRVKSETTKESSVRKFIAIEFPTEAKAYEGFHALRQLQRDRTVTVYETLVIGRDEHGLSMHRMRERPMRRTSIGAVLGAVVGTVGGPMGMLLGATAGGSLGALEEAVHQTIDDEHADDIGKQLAPGSAALLAELREKTAGPLDARMAELGGKVMRQTRRDQVAGMIAKRTRAHRAEVDRERLARATEHAEKTQLYVEADLEDARKKLMAIAEDARAELDETALVLDDKLGVLAAELPGTRPAVRRSLEQRIREIDEELGERYRKLRRALEVADAALRR